MLEENFIKYYKKQLCGFKLPEIKHFFKNYRYMDITNLSDLITSVIKKYHNTELLTNFQIVIYGYELFYIMKSDFPLNELHTLAGKLCFLIKYTTFPNKSSIIESFHESVMRLVQKQSLSEILTVWNYFEQLSKELKFDNSQFFEILSKIFIDRFPRGEFGKYRNEFLFFNQRAPSKFRDALLTYCKREIARSNIAHLLVTDDRKLEEFLLNLKKESNKLGNFSLSVPFTGPKIAHCKLPKVKFRYGIAENCQTNSLDQYQVITIPGDKRKNVYFTSLDGKKIVVTECEADENCLDYKVFSNLKDRNIGYLAFPKFIGAVLTKDRRRDKNYLKMYFDEYQRIEFISSEVILNSIHKLLLTLKYLNDLKMFLPVIDANTLGIDMENKIVFVDFSYMVYDTLCDSNLNIMKEDLHRISEGRILLVDFNSYSDFVNIETLQCNSLGEILKRYALGLKNRVKNLNDLNPELLTLFENLKNPNATLSSATQGLRSEITSSAASL